MPALCIIDHHHLKPLQLFETLNGIKKWARAGGLTRRRTGHHPEQEGVCGKNMTNLNERGYAWSEGFVMMEFEPSLSPGMNVGGLSQRDLVMIMPFLATDYISVFRQNHRYPTHKHEQLPWLEPPVRSASIIICV